MADFGEKHGKTLFVRNLPYSTTNDSLEKIFSEVGPLKSCFVVKEKDSLKCRGFGYVKFTLLEDAERALTTVKKVDGRNVHIVYANKKEKKKRFGQPQKSEVGSGTAEQDKSSQGRDAKADEEEKTNAVEEQPKRKKKKKPGVETPVKGQKQAPNPLNEGKRARLIVRNLTFKCTKEELQKAFEKCGTVVDVHIPKKASGTRLGFGFVQFENKSQAGMAVAQLNGTSVAGRQVAVDWALPKNLYESRISAKPVSTSTNDNMEDEEEEEDSGMNVDEEEDEPQEMSAVGKNKTKGKQRKGKIAVPANGDADDDKNSGNDGEDDMEEENDSESGDVDASSEDEEESDDEEESNDEDDSDDDDEDDHDENNKVTKKKSAQPEGRSDVSEGRTIFIRNLPFSAGEEEVEDCFAQFGQVKYARVVRDRNSGMSKGTAFVQFESKSGAGASLQAAENESEGGLSLEGRSLVVSLAVSREQAGVLTNQNSEEKKKKLAGQKKEEKDSRNLYLAREGMIRPGTEAAKDVPAGDLSLRTKIAESNRVKLKDQNVFVSSTRLCVHNIPPTINDSQLRKIMLRAVGDKEAKLLECRIMRDLTRVNSKGQGKSRGFAFCSFNQHTHALAALKKLNNCPTVFGDKKRPIVEFSLENRRALETKQKRLEKSQLKAKPKPAANTSGDGQGGPAGKKKRKKKPGKQDAKPLEVKKQQDKVARAMYSGPLGLPSHSGPKQRHKPRPGQQGNNPKSKPQLKQPQKQPKEKQAKTMNPKKKKRTDVDGFDKLVASYKKKIMVSARF